MAIAGFSNTYGVADTWTGETGGALATGEGDMEGGLGRRRIELVESSADLHDVRDFLGHANITTTSQYVRSSPVRLAQALERMEAAAGEPDDADERHQLETVR